MLDLYKKVKRNGNFRRNNKNRANKLVCVTQDTTDICVPIEGLNLSFNDDPIESNESPINWIGSDSESDSDECDPNNKSIDFSHLETTFVNELSKWAIECNVTKHQVRELLKICNQTLPLKLPIDPRTILHTPRSIVIKEFPNGGLYWHRGLRDCLRSKLESVRSIPQKISLNVNIDGFPRFGIIQQPILANTF